ncbi:MAG: acyl-CoA thioesterase [Ignavibacteriae bacterium]|nr:acyl-CoA thioesterase [Ignavibacteriota bacterium]
MRIYEYRHIVGFEETNILGNVYFTNFFLWQGKCREMFLRDYVPEVVRDLSGDFYLATSRSSCDFFSEVYVFDEIIVRMSLLQLSQSRITMGFDYVRVKDGKEELLARGEQQVVCMRRHGGKVEVADVPSNMLRALKEYQEQ